MKTTPYVTDAPAIRNVRPKKSSVLGSPVKVTSFETTCVRAKAMLNVPSVTMNGGSRTSVTSPPFSTPRPRHVRIPSRSDGSAGTPPTTASFVIRICPSAITVPTERSMPAVRITSVWPIASTPTTSVCCRTSDRFSVCRNRSVLTLKNAIVSTSARNGPTVGVASTRRPASKIAYVLPGAVAARSVVVVTSPPGARSRSYGVHHAAATGAAWARAPVAAANGRLPPAVGEAVGDALRRNPGRRMVRDQVDPGVRIAGDLLARLRVVDDGLDALRRHQQRVLLRRGVDDPRLDVAHAGAAAVDGHDRDVARRLAGVLQCRPGARGARLVDRVDDVDVRVLLQAVLHRGLRVRRVAAAVGHADDLLVAVLDAEALREAVVSQRADRRAGVLVEHRDRHRLPFRHGA